MAKTIEGFYVRLREAMTLRGMTASDLVKVTGISKTSMSQYVLGQHSPTTDRVYRLAVALNVDEAWLLGFDVPMERKTNEEILLESLKQLGCENISQLVITNKEEIKIVSALRSADKMTIQMVKRLLNIEE